MGQHNDDVLPFVGKDVSLVHAGLTFSIVGSVLSFVGASCMVGMILLDVQFRNEMRPRMLLWLAVLDAVSAFFNGIGFLPTIFLDQDHTRFNTFNTGIGNFFMFASWFYTSLIAVHICIVINRGLAANCRFELLLERYYFRIMVFAMIVVYLPCMIYFEFIENDPYYDDDSVGSQHYETVQVCFFCSHVNCCVLIYSYTHTTARVQLHSTPLHSTRRYHYACAGVLSVAAVLSCTRSASSRLTCLS
jgi:hypothetical protein